MSRIFLEGEKAYFSHFVEVLGSQRGISKGPKKSEIPEWREGERREEGKDKVSEGRRRVGGKEEASKAKGTEVGRTE